MPSDSSVTPEARRQELEAELAKIAEQERQQAEQQRLAEQAERDAQLEPEQREQKAEIERRADEALEREYPPAWLPQKRENNHPEQIVGLVSRIDPRVGPSKTYGTYSAVIEVRTTAGQEWTVWANESGAMYAQLLRLRVQPGEVIAIRYRGMKPSESNPGHSYHDFRLVRVEDEQGPAQPIDYDALQRDRDTPALPAPEQEPESGDGDDIPF